VNTLLGGAASVAMGWGSAGSPAFDFRASGNALPMYAVFFVCLVFLILGVVRLRRRLGSRGEPAANRPGRLGRLARFGLLQGRLLRGADSGWIHLPIFWGFVVLGLGSLTIMIDGYVLQPLGYGLQRGLGFRLFQASLDLFGLAFVLGVGLAIYRRVWTRPKRKPADVGMLIVLCALLVVGVSGFVLEGLRLRIEGSAEPWALGGTAMAALLSLAPSIEDGGMTLYNWLWWGHVVVAFGLIAAIPFTALRHVLTAPLNILASPERPAGALSTPFNLQELMRSGRFDVKVGADSFDDFSRSERLGFSACADAGHCQDACPAFAAGTQLSPMRLMRELREGRIPQGDLAEDAIWSCTFCGACTAACPTLVDPTRSIAQLRRGLAAGNRLGKQRGAVLSQLTRARNPYGSNGAARDSLASALGLHDARDRQAIDLIYWVGCAATFDARARKIAEATVRILSAAGIRCAVLGAEEVCCGDAARRIGEEGLFQELALQNIRTLSLYGADRVLTHCAHCFNTLRNEYSDLGAHFDVVHHAAFIRELVDSGAITLQRGSADKLTLHDACYVGRLNGETDAPRSVLRSIPGASLREMSRCGTQAACCGAGGGNYWYDVPRREKIGSLRVREAEATQADVLVTECPFCLKMLGDAGGSMQIRDIAEVVADSLVELPA